MADDNDTPDHDAADKPTPRRRAPRKTAAKADAPKPAAKRASRPATTAPKKPAAKPAPKRADDADARKDGAKPSTRERARARVSKAADAVGGKRNAGLIAGGLAVAGAAAAALLTLRSSAPKPGASPAEPANDVAAGGGAHQADGTDSSASFDAMIADEGTIPDAPKG